MRRLAEHSDEQFRKDLAGDYRISFKVSASSLSYAVLDVLRNKVVYLADWFAGRSVGTDEARHLIGNFLNDHSWLRSAQRGTTVLLQGSPYTLLPVTLFDPQQASSYLKYAVGELALEDVLMDDLPAQEAVSIYSPANGLPQAFRDAMGNAVFKCYDTSLVTALGIRETGGQMMSAYVNVEDGNRCQVLIFQGLRLIFINSFSYRSKNDFIYFVLAALNANGAKPGEISLKLSGNVDRSSGIFDVVYKYVRNVSFVGRNTGLNYSPFFEDLPSHRFYNLISSLS